ncbi:Glu/Leu/Phe/Val dehydrogenase dimerization domain-containing protein [Zooshikella ganghwensis]|uniref:Glu/Leu/Phe/Val dehydrogenase dimerization domain-containing protein n=1 Tax=Zooshikella ganghwensis TaxID=202772 RepID=UPI0004179180|nr:Glu/Leu/Phe/Val dehydrogenase dimerization domain-containing protein [Zooshikella ganghwensis]
MSIFSHHEYDQHENVLFCHDPISGLKAIIAIHNTELGPALGGCRMWPYATDDDALYDVLRLSRGMTYKSALAGLPLGGGKSVIIGDPHQDKSPELFMAMAEFINRLGGCYISAEDAGTSVEDLKIMAQTTSHVVGIAPKKDLQGNIKSGDPSPMTAYGVYVGLSTSARYYLDRSDLAGLRVAIQGLGHVGYRLAEYLHKAGAKLWVTDIQSEQVERAQDELNAIAVEPDAIYSQTVDVFAPCALGAVLNDRTIPLLKASVIAGAANNQLQDELHGDKLRHHGILYAPDYVINAGGIIDVAHERTGYDHLQVKQHVEGIGDTLLEIFQRADSEQASTNSVANQMAEERFRSCPIKPQKLAS